MFSRKLILVMVWSLWVMLTGCATYSDSVRDAQRAVSYGDVDTALAAINQQLEVDTSEQLPAELEEDRVLLLLERGTLLQALGDYEGAKRDMMIADQHMDWLDMSSGTADALATWLYSGSSANYKAPPYERLYLNVLNMINFLVTRDFEGARVEARRFSIMETFFEDEENVTPIAVALGNYLGGVAFEVGRDYDQAARYYSRAWHFGLRDDELKARLTALYRVTGYQPRDVDPKASGLDELVVIARSSGRLKPSEYDKTFVHGSVLAVVQTGMVPYKQAERIPIGTAVYYASSHPRYASAEQIQQANELAVSGALKWINFPSLTVAGLPYPAVPELKVDGESWSPVYMSDVISDVEAAWDKMVGPLIASALTRMVTRAIAGAVSREGAKALAQSEGSGAASAIGILAQLAVEGTMSALDKPDTRSWTLLPGAIRIYRSRAEGGTKTMVAHVYGQREEKTVEVRPTSVTVVNFSRHR